MHLKFNDMKKNIILSLLLILANAYAFAQVSPKTNIISIDVTQPENTTFTYDSCFQKCYTIGMREIGVHQLWTSLETSPWTYYMALMDIANIYYSAYNVSVDLNIDPIETNQLPVPSDLAKLPLDDPKMIKRFETLLDTVFKHIPKLSLSSLVIGSEVNVYLSGDTAKWGQYTRFFNTVSAYAKTLRKGLMVTVETTMSGLTGDDSSSIKILNAKADYIGVSYYPLNSDFTVQPVSVVAKDLGAVVRSYPSKPIYFYQYGYPSAKACKSSEQMQSDFIDETFKVWDSLSSNIKVIDFTWLHDYLPAAVKNSAAFYGISDSAFLGFLGSLGLRNYAGNGSDKPAYKELVCKLSKHGFNSISCVTGIAEGTDNLKDVNIYPNPFSSQFSMSIQEGIGAVKLFVYDIEGKCVKNEIVNGYSPLIYINNVHDGIYFYQIFDKEGRLISKGKLMKIH